MADFKETRRQSGIQKKHSTSQKRSKKKTKTFLGQICYKLRTRNIQGQPKVYKILKHISKDIKETAHIQGGIDENVFLQYYENLWNTTNTNELQLEHNSANHFDTLITFDELEKVLKLTKNGKTPGQDNINSELYKYAPKDFKLRLLHFLNNIYRQNRIPDEWRNAVITPIFKKGDRREPQNYRGISILNTCYKIYAKILTIKLQKYSEAFLSETQNGFRKGRSCTDPTFCLKVLIEKRREFNLETHLLFIDYEKAFDNIERQILFNILQLKRIPDALLKAIVDVYTKNKIMIKFFNKTSKRVEIDKGVRQGCPLSPTLFNIYLDDIITKWQKQDTSGIKLSKNHHLSTLLFADDQVLIADTEDNLQKAAHKLNRLITEYGLTISIQKTKSMAFKGRDPIRTKIVIDNKIIQQVKSFKYLGNKSYERELDIDNKLNSYL